MICARAHQFIHYSHSHAHTHTHTRSSQHAARFKCTVVRFSMGCVRMPNSARCGRMFYSNNGYYSRMMCIQVIFQAQRQPHTRTCAHTTSEHLTTTYPPGSMWAKRTCTPFLLRKLFELTFICDEILLLHCNPFRSDRAPPPPSPATNTHNETFLKQQ